MTVSYALVLLVAAVVCSGYGSDEACLRFGGGSCCPLLNALNRKLSEVRIVNAVFFCFVASLILL